MAATAASWFYRMPEKRAYYLAERVNGTLWDARIYGLSLNVTRAEPPFEMRGTYNGAAVRMEWEPSKWLRLTSAPAVPGLADGLTNVLFRKPALRYETADGDTVWEWWVDGAEKRWQEVQGKPAFRRPVRLDNQP
jgi:hypothetical protein